MKKFTENSNIKEKNTIIKLLAEKEQERYLYLFNSQGGLLRLSGSPPHSINS